MQKSLFLFTILFFSILQASKTRLTRTDSRAPKSKLGKRYRTPSPELNRQSETLVTRSTFFTLPENPSAPIKNDFLEKYKKVITAFIHANPDQLAKHTFSIQYKKSTGAIAVLTMNRGTTELTLTHNHSAEETQNVIETARLCGNLANMQVDDSIPLISTR